MVTDRLIALAASPDELSAVIAHEAAHVEKRHVMQSVWRSFGFGVLLDAVVGGGTGAGQQAVLLIGSSTNLARPRR
jgi:Zn-dependent protease with chaperone function